MSTCRPLAVVSLSQCIADLVSTEGYFGLAHKLAGSVLDRFCISGESPVCQSCVVGSVVAQRLLRFEQQLQVLRWQGLWSLADVMSRVCFVREQERACMYNRGQDPSACMRGQEHVCSSEPDAHRACMLSRPLTWCLHGRSCCVQATRLHCWCGACGHFNMYGRYCATHRSYFARVGVAGYPDDCLLCVGVERNTLLHCICFVCCV